MSVFPGRGRVAIVKASPATVSEGDTRVVELAGLREVLPPGRATATKITVAFITDRLGILGIDRSTKPWRGSK